MGTPQSTLSHETLRRRGVGGDDARVVCPVMRSATGTA